MKIEFRKILAFLSIIILQACATYKPQYTTENSFDSFPETKKIEHSFYLIGDGGNSPIGSESDALKLFKEALNKAPKESTVLFLGDNIYPHGLPKKNHEERAFAEHQLNIQTKAVEGFKGETIFLPGNHDWYSGLKGLKRQEDYIEDILGKNSFLPENGCPIKKVNISEAIVLIIIDSEWYLTNWDKHPTINDNCEIKTRTLFFDEVESEIKKARGKTTLIALHHPMFSNGPHGGQFSAMSHLKPVPVLGTLKNVIRKTGGVVTVDLQNSDYNIFKKRIVSLAQENEKVVFVSGHEHSLQYIIEDNLPQIISGSGSKTTATRNVGGGEFSYGAPGFTRLDVFKDGSSFVRFYTVKDDEVVFQTEVISPDSVSDTTHYVSSFESSKLASVYSEKETGKGAVFKAIWGDRYRKYYGTKVHAPTVSLDTLFGGLTPTRKGGGHQSKSLRLEDKSGREYVMRALRKSAVQYIQAVAFKDQFIDQQFDETYTEGILLDAFTGAHPYAPFVVGTLSDAIGVYHANPTLYYVPKQKTLSQFNNEFGDALYMIEERAASGHGNQPSFGNSNKIISTYDLFKNLNKNEDHVLDEESYIKARLFDMLIGDWDRHEDQWRWATFKENGETVYRPIPRDRDQVFSIMADGSLMKILTRIIPALRLMQSYDAELRSTKWFNFEPYPLDVALIVKSDKTVWDAQVNFITTNLTDDVIDNAFLLFPVEVQDETIADIKRKLIGRRANLQKISDEYYKHINKVTVIKGTNKDDWFEIERLPNNKTKVTAYRIKKGEKADIFHKRTYSHDETKEIWVYGLDDEDVFHVHGTGDAKIKVRIVGGQNEDSYNIEKGKKIKMYDYKSKKSNFESSKGRVKLTDDYDVNVYDHKKLKNNSNQLFPSIGINPDDGLKLGFVNTYTAYGFERNPFTSQHRLSGAYYFATTGFNINYKGEFSNIFGSWNLGVEGAFTNPNYTHNFFGYGNSTPNPNIDDEANFDLDYNRVRLSVQKIAPSLIWKNSFGASFKIGVAYEAVEVEETRGRFVNTFYVANGAESYKQFMGVESAFSFINKNNKAFPTLGLETNLVVGLKTNIDESKSFSYLIPELGFNYKLIPSGQLVLATKLKGHVIFGEGFEFYQAASLGASDGLRGYRNQRFSGQNSFYQNMDLRLNFPKIKTGLLPLNIGVYGGFDYGKVWVGNDLVSDPGHNNDDWNNSVGGGVFLNGAEMMIANFSIFNSDDSLRFAFGFGFQF